MPNLTRDARNLHTNSRFSKVKEMSPPAKLGTKSSANQSVRVSKTNKKNSKRNLKNALDSSIKPIDRKATLPPRNKKSVPNRKIPCQSCGLCCHYIAYEINQPSTVKHATEILWHLYHPGVSIWFDGQDWYGQLETRCIHNGPDNLCNIYPHRPDICRQHDPKTCEINSEEDSLYFNEVSEFLYYLKQHNKRIFLAIEKKFIPHDNRKNTKSTKPKKRSPFEMRYRRLRNMQASGSYPNLQESLRKEH